MKTPLILISALLSSCFVQSQETVAASAGDGLGSSGTSSYTIGQVFYIVSTANEGSVNEGVQQAIEFDTMTNPELTSVQLEAVTYPNPSTDHIVLSVADTGLRHLSYVLLDVQGKVLSDGPITNSDTQICIQHLSVGTYVLKVNQNNFELKTFKILKK